jgi:cation/acetate symporter
VIMLAAGIAATPHLVMRAGPTADVDGARRSSAWGFVFVMLIVASAPAYAIFASLEVLGAVSGASPDAWPGWVFALGADGHARVCGDLAVSQQAIVAACDRIGRGGSLDVSSVSLSADGLVLAFPAIAGLPPVLSGVVAVGGLAATLAAAGSLLFAVASALGHDLYPIFDSQAPTGRRLITIRLMLIAVAVLAGWVAVSKPDAIVGLAAVSLSIAAAGLFPVLCLGIWWKRCTSLAALCGMLSGTGVAIFYFALIEGAGEKPWSFFGLTATGVPGFAAGVFGVPVAFLVAILVSSATPAETERQAAIGRIRRPEAAGAAEDED